MARAPSHGLIVDPFLHVTSERIDHPITGRTLTSADPGYAALSREMGLAVARGDSGGAQLHDAASAAAAASASATDAVLERLAHEGWLIPPPAPAPADDLARRFRLQIVSLETHTACNQACYFCPVSIDPRARASMPDALFTRIVDQLVAFRETIAAVFLSNYNEPTLDPRFIEHCEHLMRAGLPVALNTNATGLTPARVDQLLHLADGGLGRPRLISVNLSTLNRARYAQDRGHDHLPLVLQHLDYAKDRHLADLMTIAVLGGDDATHREDFEHIRDRFAGSRFEVRMHTVMDRAGRLPIGLKPPDRTRRLAGCDNLGSRPLQHLHITPAGRSVFCCEDYDERYVIGDLHTMTVRDVLEGDAVARLRRWSYGLDEAPDDFICRQCIFALRR